MILKVFGAPHEDRTCTRLYIYMHIEVQTTSTVHESITLEEAQTLMNTESAFLVTSNVGSFFS